MLFGILSKSQYYAIKWVCRLYPLISATDCVTIKSSLLKLIERDFTSILLNFGTPMKVGT